MRKTALFYPLLFRNKSSWNTVNCDTCHIFIETTFVDILIYSDSLTQTIQEPHSGVFCIPNYPIQCSKARKWFPVFRLYIFSLITSEKSGRRKRPNYHHSVESKSPQFLTRFFKTLYANYSTLQARSNGGIRSSVLKTV